MRLVLDPAIATKIARMKERVRWQHPLLAKYDIDQTRLEIAGDRVKENEALIKDGFSFLVIGDSGTSRHVRDRPQRRITKQLLAHSDECEFILHTGDVVYLTGSSEQYPDNFIKPYREFIVGAQKAANKVRFDRMVFKKPFLPVLGNHDYYDLSLTAGLLSKALSPLRKLLHKRINLDVGWHGSYQGDGFARAFLDYLQSVGTAQLAGHIEKHYLPASSGKRCLQYIPGEFTRLPNRYYTFRRGGIDFFALDSNTFNAPQPLPTTEEGRAQRKRIEAYQAELEAKMAAFIAEEDALDTSIPKQAERATSLYAKIEQIEEQLWDIEKQLNAPRGGGKLDVEQLDWLRDRLIASWQDPEAKGRVLYFHHPPYVTEKTKWFQAQTLAVRFHLRQTLNKVEAVVGDLAKDAARPLVDLVLSGHAHCFEYLRTEDTGHGDRNIPWIVCGGSGFSLRRQRKEGPVLEEYGQPVATCHLFIGRSGQGSDKRRPYSALRVDVNYTQGPDTPEFVLRPLVAERYQREWAAYDLDPIVLRNGVPQAPVPFPDPPHERNEPAVDEEKDDATILLGDKRTSLR